MHVARYWLDYGMKYLTKLHRICSIKIFDWLSQILTSQIFHHKVDIWFYSEHLFYTWWLCRISLRDWIGYEQMDHRSHCCWSAPIALHSGFQASGKFERENRMAFENVCGCTYLETAIIGESASDSELAERCVIHGLLFFEPLKIILVNEITGFIAVYLE